MKVKSAYGTMQNLISPDVQSVGDALSDCILGEIASGNWPVGYTLPSEQALMEQFGVSRIAVRECILKLRAPSILTGSRGRRTQVAKIDSRMLGRLFPLILANEAPQSFEHVFQVRLMVESSSAYHIRHSGVLSKLGGGRHA